MFSLTFVALEAESGLSLSGTPKRLFWNCRLFFCPLPLHLQALTEHDCRMSENHLCLWTSVRLSLILK